MNLRENNKLLNKQKILNAARDLVLSGGLEALSMRELAERAQVSSRTPYNLFGSKTDVLLGLLDEPRQQLWQALPPQFSQGIVLASLEIIERVYALYSKDMDYYRQLYWGLMTSDHAEVRRASLVSAKRFAMPLLDAAVMNGELVADTDVEALTSHVVMLLAGLLGLWGAGLCSSEELLRDARAGLVSAFLAYSPDERRPALRRSLLVRHVDA